MKRLIFFIPAIIFTIFYGLIALAGGLKIMSPMIIAWVAFLWIAGVLLCKNKWWSGLLGIIPGVCFIYMGTQDTGQIFSETPLGVVIVLYYVACMYFVYKKSKARNI